MQYFLLVTKYFFDQIFVLLLRYIFEQTCSLPVNVRVNVQERICTLFWFNMCLKNAIPLSDTLTPCQVH
mgnify:CR=1 FL=1